MNQITRILLALVVFTLPFDQAFTLPGIGSLSRAAGLLLAFAGLLTLASGATIRLRKLPVFLLVFAAFVVWNALTVLWSIDRVGTAIQAFTYVQLWVLVWLLWQFVTTPGETSWLRQAFMAGTWFTVGTVAWNYFTGNPTIDAGRFSVFDTNANYTAQSIALALPMAFDAAVNGRGFPRIAAILLIPATIFGVLLTGSRSGALIAAAAIVVSILLIVRGRAAVKALLLAGIAAVVIGLVPTLPDTTLQRLTTTLAQVESADFSGRGDIWRAGAEAWLYHPALGAGTGNFRDAVAPTLGIRRAPHNSFLGLLVEVGPIGPVLFFALFVIAALPHVRILARGKEGTSAASRRFAALHVVLLSMLFVAQLPTGWQYLRVTWFLLGAATLDAALMVRPSRRVGVEASPGAT